MPPQVQHAKQSLTLADPRPLIRVEYAWNRVHYHPRVLRLKFETLGENDDVDLHLDTLLGELHEATADSDPLLYRTTLPESSVLVEPLKKRGFLETRRVFEPVLSLWDMESRYATPDPDVEIRSLAELLSWDRESELLDLFVEVYARTSRLDPATPENLSREEWLDLVLADSDLQLAHSSCALAAGRLVGLACIYRTEEAPAYELGVFGVSAFCLELHQELCIAMLLTSIDRLRKVGGETLTAEIDSDDPWALYACAELPFRYGSSAVTLTLMPNWLMP